MCKHVNNENLKDEMSLLTFKQYVFMAYCNADNFMRLYEENKKKTLGLNEFESFMSELTKEDVHIIWGAGESE